MTTSEEEFSSQTSISSWEDGIKIPVASPVFPQTIIEVNEEQKPRGRLLIAEDLNWAKCPVPDLIVLCTQSIVQNFLAIGPENILQALQPRDRIEVMKLLSTDLPLELTVPLIDDNLYWERCCRSRWNLCDVQQYDLSWKKMFVERHIDDFIENFQPDKSEPSIIENNIQIFKNLLVRVNIKQLYIQNEEKNEAVDFATIGRDLSWKHFDVGNFFKNFPSLQEVNLSYAPKNCGFKINWDLFKFTDEDCLELCGSLEQLTSLKVFHLYNSSVSDFQTELLVSKFVSHAMLSKLDLCYNMIGDIGCQAIAKLLISPCPLECLALCHNKFSEKGAIFLAAALTQNNKLRDLDLSLNRIGDKGGVILFKSLQRNSSLENLNISGCGLGEEAGMGLCAVIQSSKNLKKLDISANSLGVEVGKKLRISLEGSASLVYLNVRFCQFDDEDEVEIGEMMIKNSFEILRFHHSHSAFNL